MPDYDEHYAKVLPTIEERVEAGARAGARGRRAVHPRHRAPRVAADRQPAARPLRPPGRPGRVALLPVRRGRPRAAVRRRAHLQDPRPPRAASTRRATRSRSRPGCSPSRSRRPSARSRSSTSCTRKHTLEYDDVLNQQREVIYTYRDEVLEGRDMSDAAREEIASLIERLVERVHGGRLRRGLGRRRACSAGSRRSSRRATRSSDSTPTGSTARISTRRLKEEAWRSTTVARRSSATS